MVEIVNGQSENFKSESATWKSSYGQTAAVTALQLNFDNMLNHGSQQHQGTPNILSFTYANALQLAVQGDLSSQVLDALQKEHELADLSGPSEHLLNVKINLGVLLLQLGNRVPEPACLAHYKQARDLFTAALKLDPQHSLAIENLQSANKNIQLRSSPV